jgi:hypothetical protein
MESASLNVNPESHIVSVSNDKNKEWTQDHAFFIPDPKTLPDGSSYTMDLVQPSRILIPLMEHQKFALNYCHNLENRTAFRPPGTNYTILTNKALYCDPVGSGKSLVMLSLISENPVVYTKSKSGQGYSNGICVLQDVPPREIVPITLIVVPNTLFNQWKDYVQNQTTLIFKFLGKKADITSVIDCREIDGILINSNFYNDIANIFKDQVISRVIFDEVHMMKIPASNPIEASFNWFISASPCEIERFTVKKHGFLTNSLKSILSPSIAPKCGVIFRNDQANIDLSIKLPPPNIRVLKVRTSNILNVLNGIVSSTILEAIAAGDSKSAMEQLSLEKTDEDNIISIVNKHLETELESLCIELESKKIRTYSAAKAKQEALEKVEEKIKEVKKKIQDIKDRIFKDNIDPITYDEIVNPVITKCCQNKFEFTSLTEYLLKSKQACPMCRKPMSPKDLVVLNTKSGKQEVETAKEIHSKDGIYANKAEALEFILTKKIKKDSRILISSGPTGNFQEILQVATQHKMSVRQLIGNIQTKNKILDDFKKGTLNILYLPAYESGSGLNLIEVADMILYHKMPNGIEDQVIGRCQRLGRTKPLNLFKIYFENEI